MDNDPRLLVATAPGGGGWPIDDLPVGLVVLRADQAISVNEQWAQLTGLDVEASVGAGWWAAVAPADRPALAEAVRSEGAGDVTIDWRSVSGPGDGSIRWRRSHLRRSTDGAPATWLMAVTEIDRRADLQGGLGASVGRDSLTGLLDRSAFMAEVAQVLERGQPVRGLSAVLFIDLDHFKDINDLHGHGFGDRVLVAVGRRVQSVLRATDHLGRLGGDEMAVLVPAVESPREAEQLAERIVLACGEVFGFADGSVRVGASVGVACSDGAQTAATLVDNADRAMYRAKLEGRGRWSAFAAMAGAHPRDHLLEARATLDQTGRSIERAGRHIGELWRDLVDHRDDEFSTSLVDVSHALRHAGRVLDRHAARYGALSTPSMSPTGVRAAAGTASGAPSTAEEEPVAGTSPTSRAPATPEPGGAELAASSSDRTVLRMWGDHDLSTAGVISTVMLEAVARDDLDVVVDLSAVAFMDGSTVTELALGRSLLLGRRRTLTVAFPSGVQRRLLEVCGLAGMIEDTSPGRQPRRRGAASTLETWVAVPPAGRADEGSSVPLELSVATDAAEHARR